MSLANAIDPAYRPCATRSCEVSEPVPGSARRKPCPNPGVRDVVVRRPSGVTEHRLCCEAHARLIEEAQASATSPTPARASRAPAPSQQEKSPMPVRRPSPIQIEGYIASPTADPPSTDGLFRWSLVGDGRAAFLGRIGEPMVRVKALEKIRRWEASPPLATDVLDDATLATAERESAAPPAAGPPRGTADAWTEALLAAFEGVPPVGTYQLHDPRSALASLVASVRRAAENDTQKRLELLERENRELQARIDDVNAALDELGIGLDDSLEEGDAIRTGFDVAGGRAFLLALEDRLRVHGFESNADTLQMKIQGAVSQLLARATSTARVTLTEPELLARMEAWRELKQLEGGMAGLVNQLADVYAANVGARPAETIRQLLTLRAEALRARALMGGEEADDA